MKLSFRSLNWFRRKSFLIAALASLATSPGSVPAADFYWDPDGSTTGNNTDGTNLGGAGTWNTALTNWWDLSSDLAWPNLNDSYAIFTYAYGSGLPVSNTVTLGEPITANRLSFLRSGYTITGSTLTLAGTTPTLHANLGESATLASQISGTAGLLKTGGGSIRLSNTTNNYTGTTTIANGTLILSNQSALGASSGAVVVRDGNGLETSVSIIGYPSGSLVLDGSTAGFTFSRDLDLSGGGPIGGRGSALVSLGNNTLSGTVNTAINSLTPTTFKNTGLSSVNGTLTLSGTLNTNGTSATTFTRLGGINTAGVGNFALTGVLIGTGSIEKSGAGTLFLNPSSVSGFGGTVRVSGAATVQQSSVRVTQATVGGTSIFGANTATTSSSAIDLNGGVLEFRSDSNLNFGALPSGKNVYNRASSTIFTGLGAGGSAINGTTTLGALQHAVSTSGMTTTLQSRNGFGVTFSSMAIDANTSTSTLTNTLSNSLGGMLTFTGNLTLGEGNTASRPRVLAFSGNGNTLVQGSIIAGTATDKSVTKSGSGNLTIVGTGTTVAGNFNITGGAITITDFRSLNNNTAAISLGNAGTTGGNLIIGGTGGTPTVAGLTTSKTITLNTTSGSNSIYANQTGSNPVILNGAITKIAGATTGNLILGGTNTADNLINSVIPVEPTPSTGGLQKVGSGTWVLAGANTYKGTTTISNGTLKLRANAPTSTVLPATNVITFGSSSGFAGATLELVGQNSVNNVQNLGTLNYGSAGAHTLRLTPGAGGSASLTFANIATSGGGTLNIVGADFTTNKVTFTQVNGSAGSDGILTRSVYWNGADFAYRQGGVMRAPVYGTDTGTATTAAGPLTGGTNHQITGSFSTGTVSIATLKIAGAHTLTVSSGSLTLTGAGVLATGGNAAVTGAGTIALGSTAFVIRVNEASDTLTLSTADITGTGGLTKSGAGTLILATANGRTGTTEIAEGTVRLSGSGTLSGANATANVRQAAVLDLNGISTGTLIGQFNNMGVVTNSNAAAATLQIGNNNGTGTSYGVIQDGAGVINVTKIGTGAQSWLGASTYTGVTTIGSTGLVTVNTLADGGVASGIGASSNAAANLVFNGSTGGLVYQGSILNDTLTLGSRSASTDRLFTLAGTGARFSSTVSNNNAIVWSNTGAIVHGVVGPQLLTFEGTSTGDNTFNPQITDSGTGANITSVTKTGTGQWNLGNSNNTHTGTTSVANGVLALNQNGALPANSPVVLGSAATSGILQMSGTFARNLTATPTAGAGTITWGGVTGGGGFAAHSTSLTVTLNGGAGLTWGSGGFVGTGGTQALIFNSTSSLADVTFTNAIDLGASVRTVTVNDNVYTGAEYAVLSGALSGAGGGLLKNGDGVLKVTGANTYTGTTEVQAGTLVVSSLGSSSDTPSTPTSVGVSGVTFDNSNAIVLGNATTTGGIFQYVGAGEISDRKIRLRGTAASNQIHADGSGALILTNVAHDTVETGSKTLFLRGNNTAGNRITSQLSDNGAGVLSVTVDGSATWILTNGANNYTGTTTVSGGALGIGHNTALGSGGISVGSSTSGGAIFAYGGDRTIGNAVTESNTSNGVTSFIGDHSLTFTGAWTNPTSSASGRFIRNNIVTGKTLTIAGDYTFTALTSTGVAWNFDGSGDTIISGRIHNNDLTKTVGITYSGNGSLTLSNATNSYNGNTTVSRGTLRAGASEVIPDGAGNGSLVFNPTLALAATATFDLNGNTETVNGLTATTDGTTKIDNTSATAATFRFGANDSTVNFGSGTGSYTITDTGAGALSIVKLGNTSATFSAGINLTYQGATRVEGGSLTVASPVNGTTALQVVNSGSTLALTGGITAPSAITSVVVENGATLALLDGAGNKLNSLTNLQLGSSGGTMTTLNLNVGDQSVAGDELFTDTLTLLTGGTLGLTAGNQITFNLTDIGLNPSETYELLHFVDGGFTSGPLANTDYLLGATPGGFSSISLTATNTSVFITTGTLITGDLYWRGLTDNTWNFNVNNWSTDKAGMSQGLTIPGAGTDVIFAYDSIGTGALTTTLEQNFKVNSLTFETGTTTPASVTIASGAVSTNRLEIAPQVSTDGIAITTGGPAAVTISAPVKLGRDQTWNVADAASTLTLSGGLQGEKDVIQTGIGKVIVSAAADPTFNAGQTADFTLNAGTFEIQNTGALGSTANSNLANVLINTGAAFYYNGAGGTVANNLTLGGGVLSAGTASQTYSGTVNVGADSFINMADSNGPAANTARNITLSGVLSGAGSLTIDSNNGVSSGNQFNGTLTINNAGNTWTGDLLFNEGTVVFTNAASPGFTTNDVTFNTFGRLNLEGLNGATLTHTGTLTYGAGAIGELGVNNTGAVVNSDFTVDQSGAVTLGSGGTGGNVRVYLSDAFSKLNLTGATTLGGDSSISLGGDAAGLLTISGVISEGGSGYDLAINTDVGGWGTTNRTVRITGLNTFTGDFTLGEGIVEFNTVTNISGGASALGNGTAIAMNGGTLRFIGSSPQSTNRPITTTAAVTLSANGVTAADTITYNGAITVGPTGDGTQITLTGAAGREGILAGGMTQTGDSADMTVNGGTWTHQTGTSRIGDLLTVTGADTILNLNSGLFQVRNDFVVQNNAVLNLNGAGVLSYNTATLASDASLQANTGAVINLGANNAVDPTQFDMLLIGYSGAGTGTLNMGAFSQTTSDFRLGNYTLTTIGQVNGTGTITATSNLDLYNGAINANLANTGTFSLDKYGAGTVTLSGDNSGLASTGATILVDGTLILDYTASNTTKLRAASQLEMRGADLILNGNATAATTQTVGSFNLDSTATDDHAGANVITLNPGAGQEIVLNLGAITRSINTRDGTVHFALPSGTQSATNGFTTATLNTNGMLGTSAFATVQNASGIWFATNSTNLAGGNIIALASVAKNDVSTWLPGEHITDETSGFTGTVATADLGSLRFGAAGGSDLALGTTGVLGLSSGGLLVTNSVGGTPSIAGGTLFSGARSSDVPELIIHQNSSQTFVVDADIRINHTLMKTGTGTLQLTGDNGFTGGTNIMEGTLQTGGNGIGDTSLVSLAASRNSVLQLIGDETIGRLQGGGRLTDADYGTVDVGAFTLTLNQSASTTYSGFFTGTGSIVMNSGNTGNFTLNNRSSGFTGEVVLSGGLFLLGGIGQIDASGFTINKGGNLLIDNNDVSGVTEIGTRILDGATITLNSADGAFSGQTRPRGLAIRTNQDTTLDETVGVITVNSGANYAALEATSASDDSDIIAANILRGSGATFNIRGTNLGGSSSQENEFRIGNTTNETNFIATLVGGGGLANSQNISILPWAIGESFSAALDDANMGNSLLTYVSGTGFRPLNFASEYDTLTAAAATDNARESLTLDLTGLAGTTVNALVLHNNNTVASTVNVTGTGAGQTLAITSGALLFTLNPTAAASSAHGINLGGFDSGITVGGTNEYVIHVVNPSSATTTPTLTATISSPLTSAADITKSGRGALILSGSNTAGGGARKTTINEGVLEITDLDNIGGNTGSLVFAGGTLRLGTGLTDDLSSRAIAFLLGGGTIDTNGVDLTLAGSLGSGAGGFTKAGAGNLTLNAAATFTGGTTVAAGTLTVGANNATGNGGNLSVVGGATLALGTSSISHTLVTTSGASPLLTGTGTIAASTGFFFNHTGDTSINALLAGTGGLLKAQSNVVTLTGASTYSGTTEIQAGTLSINSIGNVGGGASALGNPGNAEAGIIRMGLTTASTTLRYTGAGHSSNRIIGMQGTTGGVTLDADGTGALVLTGGVRFEMAGNKTLTLRGDSAAAIDNSISGLTEVGGILTLNKRDANTWLVNGGNTYTGTTQIDNGVLKLGVTDALPTATTVRLGTGTTAGTFDLNGFNQTIGSLLVQTNSNSVTNNLIVDAGNTLTVTGAVTIGANADTSFTNFTATGGGSFVNNNSGGTFQVGGATGSGNENTATVDFSALGTLTANLGATGIFRVGDNSTTTTATGPSELTLAANNTITAGTLSVASVQTNSLQQLHLGSGTNLLNTDTIFVGGGATTSSRGIGLLDFDTTTGTVQIRGTAGGSSRAELNVANGSLTTTGADLSGTADFSGHDADLMLSNVVVASRGGSSGSGNTTGTLTFDQGTLDATSLTIAQRTGAGTGNATGTVNLGDSAAPGTPTVDIDSITMAVNTGSGAPVVADLNITGGNVTIGIGSGTAINMANAAIGRTTTATIDLTGGNVTVTGDIARTGGAGTENTTLTLNGATLDMSGKNIGKAAANITLAAQSGTLKNLGELNGGGALTKTTTGVLVLSTANTYTGQTTVSDGVLRVTHGSALGGTGNGTSVTSTGAVLELDGAIAVTGEALHLTGTGISNNGALRSISGNNTYGGEITLDSDSRIQSDADLLTLDVASGDAITGTTQNVTFAGAGDITVSDAIATGTGGLTKEGLGTLILGGSNTYTGATNVNAGTLIVTGSLAATSNDITLADNAILSGTGTIGGDGVLNGDLRIGATAANGSVGTLTFTDSGAPNPGVGFGSTGTWLVDLVEGTNSSDTLVVEGALTIDSSAALSFNVVTGTPYSLSSKYTLATYSVGTLTGAFAGYSNNTVYTIGGGDYLFKYDDLGGTAITLTAVPEPGTLGLLGLALGGFFVRRLRRRRAVMTAGEEKAGR